MHSRILSRVKSIAKAHNHTVLLDEDLTSNVTFASGPFTPPRTAVYFEGTNILVKIPGSASSTSQKDGILLSAHYDSVSTAPGATDDGMGVASLLALVEYFAKEEHRPRRTIVFNINNGEEDGLYGALA